MPDFSTLSRRGNGLVLSESQKSGSRAPIHLVMHTTGLKIFGEGEWLEEKHKTKRKRRSWRKLHLGLDLVSGEIVCPDLTSEEKARIKDLEREVRELRQANEILKKASAYFAQAELDRPFRK